MLELHLYQLHREMNVLNRFEAHEDRLAERVFSKLMQVMSIDKIGLFLLQSTRMLYCLEMQFESPFKYLFIVIFIEKYVYLY